MGLDFIKIYGEIQSIQVKIIRKEREIDIVPR